MGPFAWTIRLFRTAKEDATENRIYGCQYISLYGIREMGYIECKSFSDVPHFKKHPSNYAELKESDSCLPFWQIEHKRNTNGKAIEAHSPIRLKHLVTRQYLTLVKDSSTLVFRVCLLHI
jgi:hypothetical protein